MSKNSAIGLFCCDNFEETPKQKVIDLSKLKEFYFSYSNLKTNLYVSWVKKYKIVICIPVGFYICATTLFKFFFYIF